MGREQLIEEIKETMIDFTDEEWKAVIEFAETLRKQRTS